MKKVVALLLVFTMLLVLLPASALAAEESGTCGENVQWSLSGGKLTIGGSGSMYDYDFDEFAPWYGEEITSVVIHNGVTSIGDFAFENCTSLTGITIPDSVTSIGYKAFGNCTSLTGITIPDSVTSIGGYAFQDCTSLFQIDVAAGNACYRSLDGVLMDKDATKLICYPGGKKGNYTIPTGVTRIDYFAFENCTGLTGVTIPDSVTNIGIFVFENCTSLTGITIPNSVIDIGDGAFRNCTSLLRIDVAEDNAHYCSLDGVLMNKDATKLLCCPGGKKGSYAIPDGVTQIELMAFSGCNSLTMVALPDSLSYIGDQAYWDSTSLFQFEVAPGNEYYSSLDGLLLNKDGTNLILCPGGKKGSYTIPTGVTRISEYAFRDCTSLTSVTIPDGVTGIGSYAFEYCTDLTSITIPRSVTGIGEDVFYRSTSVTIYGYRNTEAEAYARAYNIPFVPLDSGFADLVEGKFYYTPVLWAVENDITSGVSATEFAPNQDCTRAQVVTFLWRAMGSPEPRGSANPFADVKSDRFYYKAVLWAAENGITSGVDDAHFAPNKTVSRGEFVTFLWRAMGKPASGGGNPFGDVSKGRFYYDAVLWAAQTGITTGTAPGAFRPSDSCTRGQVVTFLYRAFGE